MKHYNVILTIPNILFLSIKDFLRSRNTIQCHSRVSERETYSFLVDGVDNRRADKHQGEERRNQVGRQVGPVRTTVEVELL